ncbi:MAG: GNAT family N-acetyltransferase [bacterium]|nr:GNAT family N-acetyltransferase [bacterium]
MPNNKVTILKKGTLQDLREINRLISGLSLGKIPPPPLTHSQLKQLLSQKNVFVLTVSAGTGKEKKIIGFLTVYLVRIPSGVVAVSEDLLVDERYRKWGIGRFLMEYGIDLAQKKGARHISLRTNPKRLEANQLYEQMGFHLVTTNFFRINLPRKK